MELFVAILLFVLGLALIIKCGDFFVDAASWIAEASGVPKLIVGATIVSLGTTLPELFVSSFAAGRGQVDTAIGNAVGSVTANVGLIMAISIICLPSIIKRKDYLIKSILMLVASIVLLIFGTAFDEVSIVASIILFVILGVSIFDNIKAAKVGMSEASEIDKPEINKKSIIINVIKFVVGAAGIVWGADLLVDNATIIATTIGVSERIVATTIVAIGTSLPELVTTITAIAKKQSSLSIGNIIGANTIDLALILPVCSFISGGSLPLPQTFFVDILVCLAVGIIALVPSLIFKKFSRWQGFTIATIYIVYLVVMCIGVV